jgi:AcrR family transcriptional regulator
MQRIQDRAAELLAEHGDDDASMAAVEAALEVLGGSDEC